MNDAFASDWHALGLPDKSPWEVLTKDTPSLFGKKLAEAQKNSETSIAAKPTSNVKWIGPQQEKK
jgi:hypothetical protein